jgi:hypothetical protein
MILRAIGKACRKPANRIHFPRFCPNFIETRWLYDHRILILVIEQTEAVNALGLPSGDVPPLPRECSYLFSTPFVLMRQSESSKTPLARAYPLIVGCIKELERDKATAQQREMTEDNVIIVIHKSAGQMIGRLTLDSMDNLLPLAQVLSPHRDAAAQFSPKGPAGFTYDDEQVVEDALLLDDFLPQRADHENGETDETGHDEREVAFPVEEEDRAEMPEVDDPILTDHAVRPEVRESSSCTNLVARARQGVQRIAKQFRIDSQEETSLYQAFGAFLADKDQNSQLSTSLDGEPFLWEPTPADHPGIVLLSDIALRLEPLICSEAASEPTVGEQRRHLEPHRMGINTDQLLAPT